MLHRRYKTGSLTPCTAAGIRGTLGACQTQQIWSGFWGHPHSCRRGLCPRRPWEEVAGGLRNLWCILPPAPEPQTWFGLCQTRRWTCGSTWRHGRSSYLIFGKDERRPVFDIIDNANTEKHKVRISASYLFRKRSREFRTVSSQSCRDKWSLCVGSKCRGKAFSPTHNVHRSWPSSGSSAFRWKYYVVNAG